MVEEAKTGEYDCPQGGDDYFFDPVDGLQKECVCVTGMVSYVIQYATYKRGRGIDVDCVERMS